MSRESDKKARAERTAEVTERVAGIQRAARIEGYKAAVRVVECLNLTSAVDLLNIEGERRWGKGFGA